MMQEAREWSPVGAAAHPAVRARLEAALSAWSEQWFVHGSLQVASLAAMPKAPPLGGERPSWRRHGEHVCVGASRANLSRLMEKALDLRGEATVATEADRRMLEGLESALTADLASKVEQALGGHASAGRPLQTLMDPFEGAGGGLAILVDEGGAPCLWLAIPLQLAAPVVRAHLGERRAARGPLRARAQALSARPVELRATLGKAEISLAELKGLAPGDILILDTPLVGEAPARLTLAGQILAQAKLTEFEGRKALELSDGRK